MPELPRRVGKRPALDTALFYLIWFASLFFLCSLLHTSCHPTSPGPTPADVTPLPPPVDAGPCARACARFRILKCPEAEATKAGVTCEQVCENVESSGVITLDPSCVERATSCEATEQCRRGAP